MKVAFRTDASLQIGTGHVMRCLTLADALTAHGAVCQFICRAHEGNLIDFIHNKGYSTHTLQSAYDSNAESIAPGMDSLAHSHWLGATQAQDAEACAPILAAQCPDWLIVDHYALDAHWERALASYYHKLMVIDDLADRHHVCDLLLDQTFGRDAADYRPLVPVNCHLLCGSQFALLRPEFAALRSYSLHRRAQPVLRELLIAMGGVDKDNSTCKVLQALRTCALPADCRVTVVMGPTAPWLDEVCKQAQTMPWPTRVLIGVNNMAQLMAESDLAIGAAGATSWERCCLGLPTIMLVLAQNQNKIAQSLVKSGSARVVNLDQITSIEFRKILITLFENPEEMRNISECAARVVDGSGVTAVFREMATYHE